MTISHITTLSHKEKEDIRLISDQCRLRDGISLSCPEDGDEFWLLEEKGCLAALIAVYTTEDSLWECYAFTRPDCRRRGYFTALAHELCAYSEACGEPDLCFITDNRCPAALAALHSLGAELSWEEHMMEYVIPADPQDMPLAGGREALTLRVEPGDPYSVSAWEPGYAGREEACVSCCLSLRGDSAYLYGLSTDPALRRRGFASRFLVQLLPVLSDLGCSLLRLQVSGSNKAAMALYAKTGFRITETLSYYLY